MPDKLVEWLTCLLTDWWLTDIIIILSDWITECVTGLLTDWLTCWLTNLISWLTYLVTNLLTNDHWLAHLLTVWLKDWLTDWLIDWLAHVLKSCLEKKLILMPFMMWIKITVCWWKWLVFHFGLDVSSRCAITSTALDFELTFSTVSIIIKELHGCAKPHSYVNLPILENLVITWPYTARATDRPSPPQAHQYKITQSTGLATQIQQEKIAWPPGLLERKKKQSRVFFNVILDVYTHVDNRERARKTKVLAARWKWAAVKKWKQMWTGETKSLVSTYDNSSMKIMSKVLWSLTF